MSLPLHELELDVRDGALVATVVGEIDLTNVAAIEGRILEVARRERVRVVVLDMSRVEYLDSAAFAAIQRIAAVVPVKLAVARTATVYRAVIVAGLDRMAPTFETVAAALRSNG
ncbi:MAG TPA: STAS domain-containing protein [Acidimicrobiia bacterium]|nr:STAS domain-containing protein [Acidimicrobiia bacterium]